MAVKAQTIKELIIEIKMLHSPSVLLVHSHRGLIIKSSSSSMASGRLYPLPKSGLARKEKNPHTSSSQKPDDTCLLELKKKTLN